MAWKHSRVMSPAQALAQRGLLYGSDKPETKVKTPPKGAQRLKRARAEYLKAAEQMRRAARMLKAGA